MHHLPVKVECPDIRQEQLYPVKFVAGQSVGSSDQVQIQSAVVRAFEHAPARTRKGATSFSPKVIRFLPENVC